MRSAIISKYKSFSRNRILLLVMALVLVACSDDGIDEEFVYRIYFEEDTIEVARYYQNKQAAVSLTFDDGNLNQYEYAAPQLEKRGLRGTFFINGKASSGPNCDERNVMSPEKIADLNARGHEIGNHTWSHIRLTDLSLDSARREISMTDSVVLRWIGHIPYSLSFPHNDRNDTLVAIAQKGRIGVRTFETGFGQDTHHSTYNSMCLWTQSLIGKREWGVAMYHGITKGYDCWKDTTELWRFWDYLKTNENIIWTAKFSEVSAYVQEASNVKLEVARKEDKIYVRSICTLDPNLFRQPLTLIIKRKGGQYIKDVQPNDLFEL